MNQWHLEDIEPMTIKYKICIEIASAIRHSAYLGMISEDFHRLQNEKFKSKMLN